MQSLCESKIFALGKRMRSTLNCSNTFIYLIGKSSWRGKTETEQQPPEEGRSLDAGCWMLDVGCCLMLSIQSQMGGQQNKSALHL